MAATAVRYYDYLVQVDPSWPGPNHVAGRPLTHAAIGYDGILLELGPSEVFNTIELGRSRSSAQFKVANVEFAGKLVSEHCRDDPPYNLEVTILERFRDTPLTTRTIFVGIIRKFVLSETTVTFELVDPSLGRSTKLGKEINETDYPRADEGDRGEFVPVPFNAPDGVRLPVLEANARSRLTDEITRSQTTITVENVKNFTTGPAKIGREDVTVTSVLVPTQQLVVTRGGFPTEHPSGELVYMNQSYTLGFDASNRPSSIENIRARLNDEEFLLRAPDLITSLAGVRVAQWSDQPTFVTPVEGGRQALFVEMEAVFGGATAIDPQKSLGGFPGFVEKDFTQMFAGANVQIGTRLTAVRPRGKLVRVLCVVEHSGTRVALGTTMGSGVNSVDVAEGGQGFVALSPLAPTDRVDQEFLEIADQAGRRAVDTAVPSSGSATGVVILGTFGGYLPATDPNGMDWDPTRDGTVASDGDFFSFGRMRFPAFGNPSTTNILRVTLGSVPGSIPAGSTITAVRAKCRHGSIDEGNTFGNGTLRLFNGGTPVASAPMNVSSSVVTDTAGIGTSIAPTALLNFSLTIELFSNIFGTIWDVFECWFEVDYFFAGGVEEDTGSVTNQFDATPAFITGLSWEGFLNSRIQIVVDNTHVLRIYKIALVAIYEPENLQLPDDVFGDIDADIAGTPADVIQELWTDAALGNNPLSTIDTASIAAASARQALEGFTAADVSGVFRGEETIQGIIKLADQSRLRRFFLAAVLTVAYIEDLANLPSPSRTLSKDDVIGTIIPDGQDLETAIINKVITEFDADDIDGFRELETFIDAPSIASFSEFAKSLQLDFVRTLATAQKVANFFLERQKDPYERLGFKVSLDFNDLTLLELVTLSFGWFVAQRFEVESLAETFDHQISVKGRVLPPP